MEGEKEERKKVREEEYVGGAEKVREAKEGSGKLFSVAATEKEGKEKGRWRGEEEERRRRKGEWGRRGCLHSYPLLFSHTAATAAEAGEKMKKRRR